MLSSKNTTIIYPEQNPVGIALQHLKNALRLDVRAVDGCHWETGLGDAPESVFKNLKERVILVELPDFRVEEDLRKRGHQVMIVDHHLYYSQGLRLDRIHSRSSSEQLAGLFSRRMTDDEKAAVGQENGYIFSDFHEFHHAEKNRKTSIPSPPDHEHIHFSNFELIVTSEPAALETLAYHHQLKTPETDERTFPDKTRLFLAVDDTGQNVLELLLIGNPVYFHRLSTLIEDHGLSVEDYLVVSTLEPGCGFYWRAKAAKPRRADERDPMEQLADAVCESLIGLDRPLVKFSTVFMYPFVSLEECRPNKGHWQKAMFDIHHSSTAYQEYIYFHGYVRDLLFNLDKKGSGQDDGDIVYYEYQLKNGSAAQGKLGIDWVEHRYDPDEEVNRHLEYPVTHVGIHFFHNNINILSIQVSQAIDEETARLPFWRQCVRIEAFRARHLVCDRALSFNELARKIYLAFSDQFAEGKIPQKVRLLLDENGKSQQLEHEFKADQFRYQDKNPFQSKIVRSLVNEFLGRDCLDTGSFQGLLDDRMVVYTFWALAGGPPRGTEALSEHDALFSRILYVDLPGRGFAYNEPFIRGQMDPLIYRRWENYGNLYGFTRYSSAYTGFGNIFTDTVYPDFNAMYYQMAVIALYYRAALIAFSDQVAEVTRKVTKKHGVAKEKRLDFLELKASFMKFSNIYWFKELTNQDQGIEIFELYKNSFQFDRMYNQIKEEIDRAEEYLAAKHDLRIDDFTSKSGRAAVGFAILAIVTGYFGMNFREVNGIEGLWFYLVTIPVALGVAALIIFTTSGLWKKKVADWFNRSKGQ